MEYRDWDKPPAREPSKLDFRIMYGILPVVAFYIGYQWNAYAAIGLGFAATVFAYYASDRKGLVGIFALFGLFVATVAAVVGIVLEDERAFLARDAAIDFLLASLGLGSLLLGRPVVGLVLRDMWPALRELLPLRHRACVLATLVFVVVNIFQGTVRTWMLFGGFSVGEYLVYSRLFGWPTAGIMIAIIAAIVRRAARAEARRRRQERTPPLDPDQRATGS